MTSKIPWSRIWHLNFAETKTKTSVFYLKMIPWSKIAHQKCLVRPYLFLSWIGLSALRLVPLMIEFSVFMPHNTRKQLVSGHFFEGLQNYMEKKMREMKTKQYLLAFIILSIKSTAMVEIKHMDLIDVTSIIYCQSSALIMISRIYREGRT